VVHVTVYMNAASRALALIMCARDPKGSPEDLARFGAGPCQCKKRAKVER
ncbi:hypothetical protein BDZ89DRAFT_1063962, partial [Hymenopellis radicata]